MNHRKYKKRAITKSKCFKCGSTKRTKYNAVREFTDFGFKISHTKCKDCLQHRVDRFDLLGRQIINGKKVETGKIELHVYENNEDTEYSIILALGDKIIDIDNTIYVVENGKMLKKFKDVDMIDYIGGKIIAYVDDGNKNKEYELANINEIVIISGPRKSKKIKIENTRG